MSNPTWTREKPTVAGWYWWKRPGYEPTIAEVYGPPGGLLLWLPGEDTTREESISVSGAYDDTEFLGPITPDSFQQGRVAGLREAVPLACKYCNDRTKWTPMSNSGYHVCNMPEPDFVRCQAIKIHAALAQQAQDEKGGGDANTKG